jgi:hypothetical protein
MVKIRTIGIIGIKINPNYANFYRNISPELRICCPKPIAEIKQQDDDALLREIKPTNFDKEEEMTVKALVGFE